MKNNTAAKETAGSHESKDRDSIIVEETSSELKSHESSRRNVSSRPQSIRRLLGNDSEDSEKADDRDKTRKNSNKTGNNNEDESSTSPLTNVGEVNGNRNTDNPVLQMDPQNKKEEWIRDFRHKCGVWVNNDRVQVTMVTFISINAIMMGMATFGFIKNNPVWYNTFEICDLVFLIIFTIELVMQTIYHGIHLLSDGWLVFDLIIITFSWGFRQLQIVRAFRIFRVFRLVTRVKIMKDLILGKKNNQTDNLASF